MCPHRPQRLPRWPIRTGAIERLCRTIILFRQNERAFFVYGFAKSDRANLRPDETATFKEAAKHVLNLSDVQLDELIARDHFEEVDTDG